MCYLIDGYNLLFQLAWDRHAEDLEKSRLFLIKELDRLASILHIELIIVFDAPLQTDEMRRAHFNSLEIVFTGYGETADDYLIHKFEELKNSQQFTLVSADKKLGQKAKHAGLKIMTPHAFISLLRKKVLKKKQKPEKMPLKKVAEEKPKEIKPPVKKVRKGLPPLSDFKAWQEIFEERFYKD